jgi:DNA polymerase-3 subunit alpha
MQVARDLAGYSMAEADNFRKAMGKKIKSVMKAERKKFVAGCAAQGHPESLGQELWDAIEPFAGYGFNIPHSACYAYIAYQTAYLKAHYPAEYMAAILTSTKKDKDRTALYLGECRSIGVDVLVPDVNESEVDFTVREHKVRFGLSAVRNVGEGVVERIIEARTEGGPFLDFQDFVNRVDVSALNRRTVESLIKAGAFDALGLSRKGLILTFEQILESTIARRRKEDLGQFSLFGGQEEVFSEEVEIPDDEWEKRTKLGFEKEMLGLFISDHPLLGIDGLLRREVTCGVADLMELSDGASITVGGLVSGINRRFTRAGDQMIYFTLEDLAGSVEVVAFPRTVNEYGPLIREDAILLVKGRLDHRGEDVKVMGHALEEPQLESDGSVTLEIPARLLSPERVQQLKDVLVNHPGVAPVYLHLTTDTGHKVLKLGDDHRVEPRSDLYAELRELFGQKAIL